MILLCVGSVHTSNWLGTVLFYLFPCILMWQLLHDLFLHMVGLHLCPCQTSLRSVINWDIKQRCHSFGTCRRFRQEKISSSHFRHRRYFHFWINKKSNTTCKLSMNEINRQVQNAYCILEKHTAYYTRKQQVSWWIILKFD